MRKKIIAGNWKMYKNPAEAVVLVEGLKKELAGQTDVEAVVCPPFVCLTEVARILTGTNIAFGGQNLFWEAEGAFTGEISGAMIKATGAEYVIIGHSERRQYFGETNETVNRRLKAALKYALKPIVCVGENLAQREAGKTFDVVKDHVTGSLAGLSKDEMKTVVIAYEPVWAIGTGKTATSAQAQEVHKFIRGTLVKMFDQVTADATRIQYGGSVKPENAAELMSQADIDGALVGGASLKADSFAAIIKNTKA
ncbi:MAG: triose-phosphate isomerase [Candidatus Omnitrophota bacterium]